MRQQDRGALQSANLHSLFLMGGKGGVRVAILPQLVFTRPSCCLCPHPNLEVDLLPRLLVQLRQDLLPLLLGARGMCGTVQISEGIASRIIQSTMACAACGWLDALRHAGESDPRTLR
eukprot:TRINITY_DN5049_c0_g1_i1.p1 TRINITY_DN5049_c0_g1~~TRINITY_DN5049_c0_g1_i1.p1  ORF type:complete len:118 (-),score=10.25 TRINITY_DN5049_c0_g1_i1:170-523(-)